MPVIAQPIAEFDYSYVEQERGFFDPHAYVFELIAAAIPTARAVRRKAVSYRAKPFKVGAVAVTTSSEKKRAAAFAAYNLKPDPNVDKVCAEMQVIGWAKSENFLYTPGLIVAGSTDPQEIEEVTGIATATLDPCDPCRDLLDESTVIFSVGADRDRMRVATGKMLYDLYASRERTARLNKRARRRSARLAMPEIEIPVIENDGFAFLDQAERLYQERVIDLRSAPEVQTRMLRAEAVVWAVHEAAGVRQAA